MYRPVPVHLLLLRGQRVKQVLACEVGAADGAGGAAAAHNLVDAVGAKVMAA